MRDLLLIICQSYATDFVTHMEVYVHLFLYGKKQSVAVKVKLDRRAAS